ncbi:hypothetical protein C8J56DRAFT_884645 [Mycena floridula]|nr:hypothetical protein C8J56DRAFT_884645 [Mycena floridula]
MPVLTRRAALAQKSILNALPNELTTEIIRLCDSSSQVALCRVSKLFKQLAHRWLYRIVWLKQNPQVVAFEAILSANPQYAAWVRSLTSLSTDRYHIPGILKSTTELSQLSVNSLDVIYLDQLSLVQLQFLSIRGYVITSHQLFILTSFLNRHPAISHLAVSFGTLPNLSQAGPGTLHQGYGRPNPLKPAAILVSDPQIWPENVTDRHRHTEKSPQNGSDPQISAGKFSLELSDPQLTAGKIVNFGLSNPQNWPYPKGSVPGPSQARMADLPNLTTFQGSLNLLGSTPKLQSVRFLLSKLDDFDSLARFPTCQNIRIFVSYEYARRYPVRDILKCLPLPHLKSCMILDYDSDSSSRPESVLAEELSRFKQLESFCLMISRMMSAVKDPDDRTSAIESWLKNCPSLQECALLVSPKDLTGRFKIVDGQMEPTTELCRTERIFSIFGF